MATKLPQLDRVTLNRLYENNKRNETRQAAALQRTLAEITFLESEEVKTPGAYSGALARARTKRDRQHGNLQATVAYLAAIAARKR